MNNKSILVLILMCALSMSANAKKSKQTLPDWVHTSQPGYIVAHGTDLSLEAARSKAEHSLKDMVFSKALKSVLSNSYIIQEKLDSSTVKQMITESSLYSGFDNQTYGTTYSELIKNKETKAKEYHYYIQYLLTDDELDRLNKQLVLKHKFKASLTNAHATVPTSRNISELGEIKKSLQSFVPQFSVDDQRKAECNKIITAIDNKLDSIEIKEMLNVPGQLIICLTINNKAVTGSNTPKIRAQASNILNTEKLNEKWVINYTADNNLASEIISVEFDIAGIKKTENFTVTPNEEKVVARLTGATMKVHNNNMITFYVASSCREPIVLDKMSVHYNNLHFTDTKLNQELEGAGVYNISYSTPPGFHKIELDDFVYGELHYRLKKNGKKEVFHFYNQRIERIK